MVSVDSFSGDFEDVGIPIAIEVAKQISRAHRVDYLGDTHGNYEGFLSNMKKLGLINAQGDWTGGDRILVMLGDIYADRNLESIPTGDHLEKLISQGAHIEMICGNHDQILVSYFDHVHNPMESILWGLLHILYEDPRTLCEYQGILEFAKFRGDGNLKLWTQVLSDTAPKDILSRMGELPEGIAILRNICRFQVGKVIDDTLFMHTDPVNNILPVIIDNNWDMEAINTIFRSYLVHTLLDREKPNPAMFAENRRIRQAFFSTENRRYFGNTQLPLFTSASANLLRTHLGINRIIHGHSDHKSAQTLYIGGLEVTSADNSSYRWGDFSPWNRYISAGSILTNGHRIAPKQ